LFAPRLHDIVVVSASLLRLRLHALAYLHVFQLDKGPLLDCLELFAGVETITRMFRLKGLTAVAVDIDKQSIDDVASTRGFLRVLALARRLRPNALFFAGVPCSSWAWSFVIGRCQSCVVKIHVFMLFWCACVMLRAL
jgi:hypothetical protein